jgi:molybdopterin converting factor small subunit
MEIEVEFFAYLNQYSPTGEKRVSILLKEGATLGNLIDRLNLPPRVEKICLINGTYCSEERVLQEGDLVSLFPMIDGG